MSHFNPIALNGVLAILSAIGLKIGNAVIFCFSAAIIVGIFLHKLYNNVYVRNKTNFCI